MKISITRPLRCNSDIIARRIILMISLSYTNKVTALSHWQRAMKSETPGEIPRSTKLIRKKRVEGYKLASFYREIAEQPMKWNVVYILYPQMGVLWGYALMIAWGRLSLSVVFAYTFVSFDIFFLEDWKNYKHISEGCMSKDNKRKESSNGR